METIILEDRGRDYFSRKSYQNPLKIMYKTDFVNFDSEHNK